MTNYRRDRVVRRLKRVREAQEYTALTEALTGRLLPSGTPEPNPSQDLEAGYIWIRFTRDSPPIRAVIGSGMAGFELIPNYPVLTGNNRAGLREAIKPSSINPAVRAAQSNNARNGTIPGYLNSPQFTPGLVHAWVTGGYGLNVFVEEFTYKDRVISGHLPVTVPVTSGQRGQTVIFYDYDNDILDFVAGTPSTAPAVLFNRATAAAIPIGTGDKVRLGAVLLDNGQTDVTDDPKRFYDLRDWLTPDSAGIQVDETGATVGMVVTVKTIAPVTYDLEAPPGGTGGAGDLIILKDLKSQNTDGGTFSSGAWQTRTLNTECVDTGNHCTLSSNQFTLDAGTYRIKVYAPAQEVNRNQARLYNVTHSVVQQDTGGNDLVSMSIYAPSSSNGSSVAIIEGRFTLSGADTLRIEHQCQTTKTTQGFGVAANFAQECYTIVELLKE